MMKRINDKYFKFSFNFRFGVDERDFLEFLNLLDDSDLEDYYIINEDNKTEERTVIINAITLLRFMSSEEKINEFKGRILRFQEFSHGFYILFYNNIINANYTINPKTFKYFGCFDFPHFNIKHIGAYLRVTINPDVLKSNIQHPIEIKRLRKEDLLYCNESILNISSEIVFAAFYGLLAENERIENNIIEFYKWKT